MSAEPEITSDRRLRVLLSAYACEPAKGSEPEIGWQWALQMARFHEVTVLTRANNRPAIEAALKAMPPGQPVPHFVYHEAGRFALWLKRLSGLVRIYYIIWQRGARKLIAKLHHTQPFDLLHHVTFAGYRYRTAIWRHGVPCVWGPIGGMESIPWALLPWKHPGSLFYELFRNFGNVIQATAFNVLSARAADTAVVLVANRETQDTFSALDIDTSLFPAIGLHASEFPPARPPTAPKGPLRLLFVGQLIWLKGVDLAIRALAEAGIDAELTLIGDGRFAPGLRRLVAKHGLEGRVHFAGKKPRAEALQAFREHDVMVFPSLHDSGGMAVIEAMAAALPVICLDCGGPAISVADGCGIRVPASTAKRTVTGLAAALRHYHEHREDVVKHGQAAQESIRERYEWERKGEVMHAHYQSALTAQPQRPQIIQRRSLSYALILLALVAVIGFFSLQHLKQSARTIADDNIRALVVLGAANSSLDQAFGETTLALLTDEPAERRLHIERVQHFSAETTRLLEEFAHTPLDTTEQHLLNHLTSARHLYLHLREQAIVLLEENQMPEAHVFYREQLVPAFSTYKAAGEALLRYNAEQGELEAERIVHLSRMTQFAVIAMAVALFVAGFLFGFFK
jgi:glycosyltransferase involved in cell wall biosynthesis